MSEDVCDRPLYAVLPGRVQNDDALKRLNGGRTGQLARFVMFCKAAVELPASGCDAGIL